MMEPRRDDCAICRIQLAGPSAHWAWHNHCRAELNPIALVQFIERCEPSIGVARILNYVLTCAGVDESWREAVRSEDQTAAKIGEAMGLSGNLIVLPKPATPTQEK